MKIKYAFLFVVLTGCNTPKPDTTEIKQPEIVSLLGVEYVAPTEANPKLDSNLAVAQRNFDTEPTEENFIWLGRRTAYLGRYNQAIQIFSQGIEKFPASYRLYRHRGHRFVSQRKFDEAIADFEKAVELMKDKPLEIEPDGQPNKLNIPLNSTQYNVWYHLGLAHYLKRDYTKAEAAYTECMQISNNNDLIVASADWMYMTYIKQGKQTEALELLKSIADSLPVIENDSYYKRLMLYKGKLNAEEVLNPDTKSEDFDLAFATQGYGVGNWYQSKGDTSKATEIFKKVVAGKYFSAFGFIAAEAELARMSNRK